MPSIFLESVEMRIPLQGTQLLLTDFLTLSCDATPAVRVYTMILFQNNIVPDANTAYGDLVECDFTGYVDIDLNAAAVCTGNIQGPAQGSDDFWRMIFDQQEFLASGAAVPNSVYGVAIVDKANSLLLGVARFEDAPLTVDETGDSIKVSGELILLPQPVA